MSDKKLDKSKLEHAELYDIIDNLDPITITEDASTSDLANILNDYMTDVHTGFFNEIDLNPVSDIEIETQNEVEINVDENEMLQEIDKNLTLVGDETLLRFQQQELEIQKELLKADDEILNDAHQASKNFQTEINLEQQPKEDIFDTLDEAFEQSKNTDDTLKIKPDHQKNHSNSLTAPVFGSDKTNNHLDDSMLSMTIEANNDEVEQEIKTTNSIFGDDAVFGNAKSQTSEFGQDLNPQPVKTTKPNNANTQVQDETKIYQESQPQEKPDNGNKPDIYDELTKLVEDVVKPQASSEFIPRTFEDTYDEFEDRDVYDQLDQFEYTQSLVSPNVMMIDSKEIATDTLVNQNDTVDDVKYQTNPFDKEKKPNYKTNILQKSVEENVSDFTDKLDNITNKINDFGDNAKQQIVKKMNIKKQPDDDVVFKIAKTYKLSDMSLVDFILIFIIVVLVVLLFVFMFVLPKH